MAKDTTQYDPNEIIHCWGCDKRVQRWDTYPGLMGTRLCKKCEEGFVRKKPNKVRPSLSLRKYVKDVESGKLPSPYKVLTRLVNGIKIIGPTPVDDVGPLRD